MYLQFGHVDAQQVWIHHFYKALRFLHLDLHRHNKVDAEAAIGKDEVVGSAEQR